MPESDAACPRCGGEQSVSALGVVICENGCHKEPSAAWYQMLGRRFYYWLFVAPRLWWYEHGR